MDSNMPTTDLPSRRTSGAAYLPAGPEPEPADESLPPKLPAGITALATATRAAEDAAERARVAVADAQALATAAALEAEQFQRAENALKGDRRRVVLQEIVRASAGQLAEVEEAKRAALADFTAAIAQEPWAKALSRYFEASHLFQMIDAAATNANCKLTGEDAPSWSAATVIKLDGERLADLVADVIDGRARSAAVDWTSRQGVAISEYTDGRAEQVSLPDLTI